MIPDEILKKLLDLLLSQLSEELTTAVKQNIDDDFWHKTDDKIISKIIEEIPEDSYREMLQEYLSQNGSTLVAEDQFIIQRKREEFINRFFDTNQTLRYNRKALEKYLDEYIDRLNIELRKKLSLEGNILLSKMNRLDSEVHEMRTEMKRSFQEHSNASPVVKQYKNYHLPRANKLFSGRKMQLERLTKILENNNLAVINGLSGIGKSQIAVKYVQGHQKEYDFTVWITTENIRELDDAYRQAADFYGLLEGVGDKDALYVKEVMKEFLNHENVLLVVDGADDISFFDLLDYIPANAKVIITTQNSNLDSEEFDIIPLKNFTKNEAVNFILSHTNQRKETENDINDAEELAELMEYYPLSLEYARAYINKRRLAIYEYRELYDENNVSLLYGNLPGYKKTAYTSWKLSFDKVVDRNRDTYEVMTVCSFLAVADIPLDILFEDKYGRDGVEKIQDDLLSFSLINNVKGYRVNVHGVTQDFTRKMLEEKGVIKKTLTDAVKILELKFPRKVSTCEDSQKMLSLLPHVERVFKFCAQNEMEHIYEFGGIIVNALYSISLYREAIEYLEISQKLAFNASDFFKYAEIVPLLIQAHHYLGDSTRALEIGENMLEYIAKEHSLSEKQSDYLNGKICGPIGIIYKDQGNYDLALVYYSKALKYSGKIGDIDVQISQLMNIGTIYRYKHNYEKAKDSYDTALKLLLDNRQENSRCKARILGNLGILYVESNEIKRARKKFNEAQEIAVSVQDMQTVCNCYIHIAWCFFIEKNKEQALNCINRAIEIANDINYVRGQADAYNAYGEIYFSETTDFEASERCYKKAFEISERIGYSIGKNTARQGLEKCIECRDRTYLEK